MMKAVTAAMMLSLGVLTMALDTDTVSPYDIIHSHVEKVSVGLCQLSIAATDTHKTKAQSLRHHSLHNACVMEMMKTFLSEKSYCRLINLEKI